MKLTMRNAGLVIALAALLVNSPRYVQIFLRVDGLSMGRAEPYVLGITGAATGLVLSGGQMYIAHLVAQPGVRRDVWYGAVIVAWALMLVFSVVLVAPILVAGIVHEPSLAEVLDTAELRWGWAIVAVTSVEILAAACMVAMGIQGHGQQVAQEPSAPTVTVQPPQEPSVQPVAQPTKALPSQTAQPAQSPVVSRPARAVPNPSTPLGSWLDDLAQDTQPLTQPPAQPVQPARPATPDRSRPTSDPDRAGRPAALLRYYQANPAASHRTAAQDTGLSKSTVGGYLNELEAAGAIDRSSGQVVVKADPDVWGTSNKET